MSEAVWGALGDPTRRRLLELLRGGPRTTGQLAAEFAVTRQAVMKHLAVLEEAGLVLVRRRGRERWNHLNLVPLRRAYERLSRPAADRWAAGLERLREHAEEGEGMDTLQGSLVIGTLEVEQETVIAAPPERVFDGLLAIGEWFPHRFVRPSTVRLEPRAGGRFWEEAGDGATMLYATVRALRRPDLLSMSGPMGMDGAVVGVWEVTLQPRGGGTLLRLTHRAFGEIDDETRASYTAGWGEVLAALEGHVTA